MATILGGGGAGACSKEEPSPQQVVAPPATVVAPEPEPEPQPVTLNGSIAIFKDDHLHVCMHQSLTIAPTLDRDKAEEAAEKFTRGMHDAVEENEDWSLIGSCDQFSDRTTWATCTMELPSEREGISGRIAMHYFDWATVYDSDREMRDCLGRMHGSWSAIERGSPEWREGRRADAMRDLAEATKGLNR